MQQSLYQENELVVRNPCQREITIGELDSKWDSVELQTLWVLQHCSKPADNADSPPNNDTDGSASTLPPIPYLQPSPLLSTLAPIHLLSLALLILPSLVTTALPLHCQCPVQLVSQVVRFHLWFRILLLFRRAPPKQNPCKTSPPSLTHVSGSFSVLYFDSRSLLPKTDILRATLYC